MGLKDTVSPCLTISKDLAGYLSITKNKQVSVKMFGELVMPDCADNFKNNIGTSVKMIIQTRIDIRCYKYEEKKIHFEQDKLGTFSRYDVKEIIAKQLHNDVHCLIDVGVIVKKRLKYNMNAVPIRKKDGAYCPYTQLLFPIQYI
uniref:Uncharacterized protein n=1 Tax=Strongyloides stercoralis TaxID=6248 RepID=A0AAF5DS92_STRER